MSGRGEGEKVIGREGGKGWESEGTERDGGRVR